ncbi:MAG TPA: hypothetical protein VM370_09790, partial [Candidatus Thermoplasmatota archaeon]|nr:hypothetical protein [Candidatus Thermoplasmatota archaeon]
VSAGFDAHHADPLGNLALVSSTYYECITRLRAVQPRIAAILEGGYDLGAMATCAAATAAALAGAPDPAPEDAIQGRRPWRELEARLRTVHAWLP